MFRSMTAYSRKCAETDDRSVSAEIKSVNNKFLDLNLRLPRALTPLEPRIRAMFVSAGVSRGKVDVNITAPMAALRRRLLRSTAQPQPRISPRFTRCAMNSVSATTFRS